MLASFDTTHSTRASTGNISPHLPSPIISATQALRFLTHALLACVCRCFFVFVDDVVLELEPVVTVLETEE